MLYLCKNTMLLMLFNSGQQACHTSLSASPNRAGHHSTASSHPRSLMASLSAERLSDLEDDSSRLTPTQSPTASPSASSTTSARDQPVLSLAQVSLAITVCLLLHRLCQLS